MATPSDSSLQFFQKATPVQWTFVLSNYKEVLKLKAHASRGNKKNGPEELIKLDTWYQETLPKVIHSRKEAHVTHEELVQITKWKLYRGKNRSRILDLVRINTELAVATTSKKAFKKASKDICAAINALTNLKGIGPATASAILAAGYPECCPYMADESMLATPGVEATDYTLAEFSNYSDQIKKCTDRLNELDPESKWTPHKIELALWTHYVTKELKPSILDSMPPPDGSITPATTGKDDTTNDTNTSSTGESITTQSCLPEREEMIPEGVEKESESRSEEASEESEREEMVPEGVEKESESRSGEEGSEESEGEQQSPEDLTSTMRTNGGKIEGTSEESEEEEKSPVAENRVKEELRAMVQVQEPEQECAQDLRSNGVKRRLEEVVGDLSRESNNESKSISGIDNNESNSISGIDNNESNSISGIDNKVTSQVPQQTNGNAAIGIGHNSGQDNGHDEKISSSLSSFHPEILTEKRSSDEIVAGEGLNLKKMRTEEGTEVNNGPIEGGVS